MQLFSYVPRFFAVLIIFGSYTQSRAEYTLGIEALSDTFIQSLYKIRVALVTNQTGKDLHGNRNIDLLIARGLRPTCILVPEHGLDGKVLAGITVADSRDAKTGLPVISLYGHGNGKNIDQKILKKIDLFMVDLQDCGMRHFTYISTLYTILKAAALNNKRVVVLDRPNPLGDSMEGPLVDPSLHSFISIASIPVRHGMTIGELAFYFNAYVIEKPAKLQVVKMKNCDRTKGMEDKFLAPLSPNIPSLQACYGYSFLGMLGEIKPFQVGIALGKPFQVIMLPKTVSWHKSSWYSLANCLKSFGINATVCRAYSVQQCVPYKGLYLSIPDIIHVPSFQVLLTIIDFAKAKKLALTLSEAGQKAIGTKNMRNYLKGSIDRIQLCQLINSELANFYKKAQTCFLYKPEPRLVMLQEPRISLL